MAKKSRHARSRQATHVAAAQPQEQTKNGTVGKTVDFEQEYHYVISDLRNMSILAAAMLVVLVGLSFIIQQ